MLRQKLYSAGLLIYCSLLTVGNIQKGSDIGTKNVVDNNTIVSQEPVLNLPGFDLNPTALQFAKEYVKKNTWGLEKLKKRSHSKFSIINSVFSKYNIPPDLKYLAIVESNLNPDTVCNICNSGSASQKLVLFLAVVGMSPSLAPSLPTTVD